MLGSELFFTPFESKKAFNQIKKSIRVAKKSIDIAMYSFTNHKLAKELKNAAKRGVKIRILLDRKQNINSRYSQIGYLAKYKNISLYTLRGDKMENKEHFGIMHLKLAIIDNKKLIFGSANWTNSAFKINYELIYIIQDFALAKKAQKYFNMILKKSKPY
jgi:phosphatidylserine/phosphatidylglycerophosphate/cardiolipin synthase-like enzyme